MKYSEKWAETMAKYIILEIGPDRVCVTPMTGDPPKHKERMSGLFDVDDLHEVVKSDPQGQRRAGAGGGDVPSRHHQGPVQPCQQADALPRRPIFEGLEAPTFSAGLSGARPATERSAGRTPRVASSPTTSVSRS